MAVLMLLFSCDCASSRVEESEERGGEDGRCRDKELYLSKLLLPVAPACLSIALLIKAH